MVFCNEFMSMNFLPARVAPTTGTVTSTIIVTISGIGHENEADNYILLEDSFLNFNILGITNKKRDFFVNSSTEEAIEFLKKFLKNFSRIVIISHSMGGFFAFYISTYIDIDLCVVCSPYLSLSEEEMNLSNDEEKFFINKINSSRIENYCLNNIKISYLLPKKQDKFIVILDLCIKDDNKTFYLLDKFLNKINIIILPEVGHLSLYYLEKRKIISSCVREGLEKSLSFSVKNISSYILNDYLNTSLCEKTIICIKNQIYFNNPIQCGNYYSFVYGDFPKGEETDLFIILNKHGYLMSFFCSMPGFFWSEAPFEDSRFSPIIVNFEKNMCFCFYDYNYIEMDFEKIDFEISKIDKDFIKIPFSEDFFMRYFNKFSFNDKIYIFSAINLNKKNPKNSSKFGFNKFIKNILGFVDKG